MHPFDWSGVHLLFFFNMKRVSCCHVIELYQHSEARAWRSDTWLRLTQREAAPRSFDILDPVQICFGLFRGCLAHMFPLIRHNTLAWRKQETRIQFSTGLRFPLMRKSDDQLQLGFPIILRLQAHWHVVDLRIHDPVNDYWWVIGLAFETLCMVGHTFLRAT